MLRATLALRRSFAPLGDRVLVSRLAVEEKTAGGLFLPGADEKKSSEGVVSAVGPGAVTESGNNLPMNLKEGDKVLLPEYGGMKIELDGEEKFLYRESDILGKFQ
ncbi:hypothetical protein TrRE_jg4932 [Triparma retinervis]|uniref:Chaperonin 10 n=1 Tax=Triparma retinervis TaxID=2557542 RepID=A0A9W7FAC7_9STRA|nr:hypothetical protein TrRE_jg4932 [Triparma retinervis]